MNMKSRKIDFKSRGVPNLFNNDKTGEGGADEKTGDETSKLMYPILDRNERRLHNLWCYTFHLEEALDFDNEVYYCLNHSKNGGEEL